MLTRELMQKVRRIELKTRHLVNDLLGGQYHSAFKGRGIEFEEVRPYYVGDDVRAIDWKVTARSDQPFIKLFREERELSVHLLVDISRSQAFGTNEQRKRELVGELAAVLALAAIRNNDKVGLTMFTDDIEQSLPPRKGKRHALRLIRELLSCQPVGGGTNISAALRHLGHVARRRSVVFLISDFQDADFEAALRIAARRHDIIPIVDVDRHEERLPNVGLLKVRDAETGRVVSIDTSSRRLRKQYEIACQRMRIERDDLFKRLRLDSIRIATGEDLVEPLQRFFHRRNTRLKR